MGVAVHLPSIPCEITGEAHSPLATCAYGLSVTEVDGNGQRLVVPRTLEIDWTTSSRDWYSDGERHMHSRSYDPLCGYHDGQSFAYYQQRSEGPLQASLKSVDGFGSAESPTAVSGAPLGYS